MNRIISELRFSGLRKREQWVRRGFRAAAMGILTMIGGYTFTVLAAPQSDSSTDASIDPTTGHKVVRLSKEPGRGSYNFYFHQNSFTAAGDKMAFGHINTGPGQSIWSLDIPSGNLGGGKSTHLADTPRLLGFPLVAPKSREVYYINDHTIFSTNMDTLKTRTVATLPPDWEMSPDSVAGLAINADETLLAGSNTQGAAQAGATAALGGVRQNKIDATWNAHLPTLLYTVDIRSGKITTIQSGRDWFNHVQFSPRDPTLLMFAHEGPWEKVDRIWLIRTDGSGLVNSHPRAAAGESCGHEFWAPDGQTVWCDYHSPDKSRSLVGQNVTTGKLTTYKLTTAQLSRHYNISHDGKFFAGDGDNGDPTIQVLYPQPDGTLRSESICSASDDYSKREPNVIISPDDKWVIFSSTKTGQSEVYACSVSK